MSKKCWFGNYYQLTEKPDELPTVVKNIIGSLIDSLTKSIRPDWNTFKTIIHQEIGPYCFIDRSTGKEKKGFGWNMTIGVKFMSSDYDFEVEDDV